MVWDWDPEGWFLGRFTDEFFQVDEGGWAVFVEKPNKTGQKKFLCSGCCGLFFSSFFEL